MSESRASAEVTPTSDLLILSNRLPATLTGHGPEGPTFKASAGGLATALSGLSAGSFLWVGWPGAEVPEPARPEVERQLREDYRCAPVYLTETQVEHFYNRFSNGVLWPLFHYLPDFTDFESESWTHYQEVNAIFAEAADRHAPTGGTVWVQDYHLMLVPHLLRERRPDLKIAFFLHIPFPSSEVYRLLPRRREILEGLIGSDVVGFHTYDYARHFLSACQRILGTETVQQTVVWNGREVRVSVHPIGIDLDHFDRLLDDPEVHAEMEDLRRSLAGRRVVLGIDRLDYSKGLRHKLRAFQSFLENHQRDGERVVLIQVAVPSRTEVEKYKELRRQIEELVGRINGLHSSPVHTPVNFLFTSIPPARLTALFRFADVCWVSPIRDGMNLVCQEYAACQRDGEGVLLLSEFSGAARSLEGALQVNPWDREGMAATLRRGLDLPAEERRLRMRRMGEFVRRNTSKQWARSFLEVARRHFESSAGMHPERWIERNIDPLLRSFREAPRRWLLVDYDGTLCPFAETPAQAEPSAQLHELVGQLARLPDTRLYVLSGRTPETMQRWFRDLEVGLCVEHGRLVRHPGSEEWEQLVHTSSDWMEEVLPTLQRHAAMTPGALVVRRESSVEWHWRRADPEFGQWQANELALNLSEVMANLPVRVTHGPKLVQIRDMGVHKGLLAERLAGELGEGHFLLALGDDESDEELFARLPEHAWTVRIGSHSSHARFQARAQPTAPALLRHIVQSLQPADRSGS
jgi:trehalose 6-phosphate synthase/phosphatase